MNEKTKYIIKPVLIIKNKNTVQIINNELCIIDETKNRILCNQIEDFDIIAIIAYYADYILRRIDSIINSIIKQIEENKKEIYKVIDEASRTKICGSKYNCEIEIEDLINKIKQIDNEQLRLINSLMKFKEYKETIKDINNKISTIMFKEGIEINQEFVLI